MGAELEEMEPGILRSLLRLVHQHTGIRMGENKKTLLQSRLRRRLKELGISTYGQYLDRLETQRDEAQAFINSVTTNETSFFRTTRVWEYIQNEYLPAWAAANAGKALKAWSAAASTGEEAYSIAMRCSEFRDRHPSFDFQITATDIDTEVLAVAEKAEYQGRSIEAFQAGHPALFAKYAEASPYGFTMVDGLRKKVRFETHNLFNTPAQKGAYDLVFLRNVLIYFDAADQEKVLANMYTALAPTGRLVIGESESLTHLKTAFVFNAPLIYQKAKVAE